MNATAHEHTTTVHDTHAPQDSPLESFRAPPAAGTLGTWLFTAGLTLAFAFLLIGYIITRSRAPMVELTIPIWFWFSTFVLLVSSVCLHWAYLSAGMSRTTVAARALFLSTLLAMVFILLQTPGLIELIHAHQQYGAESTTADPGSGAPYLFILLLISLHGVHALAGLGRMIVLNRHVRHEDYEYAVAHLKQMCLYWHFLAVAWVVMFGVILWT